MASDNNFWSDNRRRQEEELLSFASPVSSNRDEEDILAFATPDEPTSPEEDVQSLATRAEPVSEEYVGELADMFRNFATSTADAALQANVNAQPEELPERDIQIMGSREIDRQANAAMGDAIDASFDALRDYDAPTSSEFLSALGEAPEALYAGIVGIGEGLAGLAEAEAEGAFVANPLDATAQARSIALRAYVEEGGDPASFERSIRESIAGYRERIGPELTGNATMDAVLSGFESVPITAGALALGVATRNPNASLAILGGVTGGRSYAEGRNQGLTPEGAAAYAAVDATAEVVTERFPLVRFINDTRAGSSVVRRLVNNIATEVPSEQVATLVQDFNRWVAIEANQGKTLGDFVDERGDAAFATLIATVTTVGVTNGSIAAFEAATGVKASDDPAEFERQRDEFFRQDAQILADIFSPSGPDAVRDRPRAPTQDEIDSALPTESLTRSREAIEEIATADRAQEATDTINLPGIGESFELVDDQGNITTARYDGVFDEGGRPGVVYSVDGQERRDLVEDLADAGFRADPIPALGNVLTSQRFPVEGRITSGFGHRNAPTAGASTNHNGIDIAAPEGTPILAPADGVIVGIGFDREYGSGNFIRVDHGNGVVSRYAHLSGFDVQRGDRVVAGQSIGRVGQTGTATGNHLHYRITVDGQNVDPETYEFEGTPSEGVPGTIESDPIPEADIDFGDANNPDPFDFDFEVEELQNQPDQTDEEAGSAPRQDAAPAEPVSEEVTTPEAAPVVPESAPAELTEAEELSSDVPTAEIETTDLGEGRLAVTNLTAPELSRFSEEAGVDPIPRADGASIVPASALPTITAIREARAAAPAPDQPAGVPRAEAVPLQETPERVEPEVPETPAEPLQGLPSQIKVDGRRRTFGPYQPAQLAAQRYAESSGVEYTRPTTYERVDRDRATRIAQAYEEMEHRPNDPEVREAYDAMISETLDQWEAIKATGLQVEFITGADPYGNPRNAILDVVENNHLWVYPTDAGFGSDESVDVSDNPLLQVVDGETIGDQPVRANDIFRIVHDYFGHIKEGVGFRADGEENAWRNHSAMYSPLARKAMTTETRGQNSWVNFGPYGEQNRTASGEETIYADQKVGLLPDWVVNEGAPEEISAQPSVEAENQTDQPAEEINQPAPQDAPETPDTAPIEDANEEVERQATTLLDLMGDDSDGFGKVRESRKEIAEQAQEDQVGTLGYAYWLTEAERQLLTDRQAAKIDDLIASMPTTDQLSAAAWAGRVKRGWYRRSAQTLVDIFGANDARRFAQLLAATSPQTSVEGNLENALLIWAGWLEAGRPQDSQSIRKIFYDNASNILGAYVNNSIRVLTAEDPMAVTLSGPKVDSFWRNLTDNVDAVTFDSWMALMTFMPANRLKANRKADDGLGTYKSQMNEVYAAGVIQIRRTAARMTELTGEPWTAEEAQETVWSWVKALTEKAGDNEELVRSNGLTGEDLADVVDFATLINDNVYRETLKGAGYGRQLEQLNSQPAVVGNAVRQRPESAEGIAFSEEYLRELNLSNAERVTLALDWRSAELSAPEQRALKDQILRDNARAFGDVRLERQREIDHQRAILPLLDSITGDKAILERNDWVILSAENPDTIALSPEDNAERHTALGRDLIRMGVNFMPTQGFYGGNIENGYMAVGVTREDAIDLGRIWGQESVLTNIGLVYMDSTGVHRATDVREVADTAGRQDGYTSVAGYNFAMDMDFSAKVPLVAAESEAVSSDLSNLQKVLQQRLETLNIEDKFILKVVDTIVGWEGATGLHDSGLILVTAQAQDEALSTLNHETIHALKEAGLFTDTEWSLLVDAAVADKEIRESVERRYAGEPTDVQQEEMVADLFAKWASQFRFPEDTTPSFVQRMIERVRTLMRTMLRLGDPVTADTIFRAIESGELGAARQIKQEQRTLARASLKFHEAVARGEEIDQREAIRRALLEVKQQAALHVSPALHERFDAEFIGTGEGANAFGWGFYATQSVSVAQHYHRAFSRERATIRFNGEVVAESSRGNLGLGLVGQVEQALETSMGWLERDDAAETLADIEVAHAAQIRNGEPDQIGGGPFHARRLRTIIAEHIVAGTPQDGLMSALNRQAGTAEAIAEALERGEYPVHMMAGWAVSHIQGSFNSPEAALDVARTYEMAADLAETVVPIYEQTTDRADAWLYALDIPTDNEFLLYDETLDANSEEVISALRVIESRLEGYGLLDDYLARKKVSNFYELEGAELVKQIIPRMIEDGALNDTSGELLAAIENGQWPKATSLYLNSLGVAGSKYKDGNSRGASDLETSYNYVVFDPNLIEIKDRTTEPSFGIAAASRKTQARQAQARASAINYFSGTGAAGASQSDLDRMRVKLQDMMLPMKRLEEMIEDDTGRKIEAQNSPYGIEELFHGTAPARFELEYLDRFITPLGEKMKEYAIDRGDLEDYLYALHAPERNAEAQRRDKSGRLNPDEGSGMTDVEAKAIVNRVQQSSQAKQFDELAQIVRDMNHQALEMRVDGGLMSRAQADAWNRLFPNYVPLRGEADLDPTLQNARPEGGKGVGVRGRESRFMKGRRSKATDLLAYSFMQASEAVTRVERAKIGRALLNLAKEHQRPDFWEVIEPSAMRELPTQWAFNPESGFVEEQPAGPTSKEVMDLAKRTIVVKVDGEEWGVRFNSDNQRAMEVANALNQLSVEQTNRFLVPLAAYTRYFSAIQTAYAPPFIIKNAIRDVHLAYYTSGREDIPDFYKNIMKQYRTIMFGTFSKARRAEIEQWREEWRLAGGKIHFNQLYDLSQQRRNFDKMLANPKPTDVIYYGGKLFDAIRAANDHVESALRLSSYISAREAGRSKENAASISRNITVNFTRKGEYTRNMSALFAFWNPATQGAVNFIDALNRNKGRAAKVVSMTIGLGAALNVLNYMTAGEDDDGESLWAKVPEWRKQRNFILFLPGVEQPFEIPLGLGPNALFNLGREISNVTFFGADPLEAAGRTTAAFLDSFFPLGSDDVENLLAPTFLDPTVDLLTNETYFGTPIVPEQDQYGPPTPWFRHYYSSASIWAREGALSINRMAGGDEIVQGDFSTAAAQGGILPMGAALLNQTGINNPEVLEYMVGTVTGSAGRFVEQTFDMAMLPFDDERELDVTNDVPFVNIFTSNVSASRDRAAAYDRMNDIQTRHERMSEYEEAGMRVAGERWRSANAGALSLKEAADETRGNLRSLNREYRALIAAHEAGQIEGDAFTTERDRIDGLREFEADRFNRVYLERVENPITID